MEPTDPPWSYPVAIVEQLAGRYEVRRLLRRRRNKKVYLAHNAQFDRYVAFAPIKTEGPGRGSPTARHHWNRARGRRGRMLLLGRHVAHHLEALGSNHIHTLRRAQHELAEVRIIQ